MRRPAPVGPQLPRARDDRAQIRTAVRERRRAVAAELRLPRPRPKHRAALLATALVVLVLVGGPALLAVTPVFALRTVSVTGASPAVAAAVRARLAPLTGTPLALVDQAAVARAVEQVPAVERFSTASLPPGTLAVSVEQREAVAQVRAAGGWRTLDAAGVVLATSAARSVSLPEVRAAGASFRAAAAVLRALPAAVARRVSWAAAGSPDDVVLHLADGRQVVWGSADDATAKSAALVAALRHVAKHVHVVDVSSPGVVRVR